MDGDGALDPLASDNPSLLPAGSGGGFIADIVVTNLNTSINGFDLTLNYDTRVLNAVLIDQSGLLYGGNNGCPNGNPLCTFSTALTIDRSIGEVRVVQALLAVTSGPGGNCNTTVNPNCVNANQELFRIRFDVVGAGFNRFLVHAQNRLARFALPDLLRGCEVPIRRPHHWRFHRHGPERANLPPVS